jgi:hypothetical protein
LGTLLSGCPRKDQEKCHFGAAAVELTPDDLREIESGAAKITVQGVRYPEHIERMSNR